MQLAPSNSSFPLMLAALEERSGRLDQAEDVLRRAVAAYPSPELELILVETLIRTGKIEGPDQAREYIDRARNNGLAEGYVTYLEALILVQGERWPAAMAAIHAALSMLGSDHLITPKLNLMLAECCGRLGLPEKRMAALHAAVRDDASARPALAEELARSGDLKNAIAVYLDMIDRHPDARLNLVRLLIQSVLRQPRGRRNWEEVNQRLHEAEQALPHETEELATLRAELFAAQDRREDARALVASAQAMDPRSRRLRIVLANLTQQLGEATMAQRILDQAETELGPSVDLQIARLNFWVAQGGEEAKAATTRLAQTRSRFSTADQPAFVEALARATYLLGDLSSSLQHRRELSSLRRDDIPIMVQAFEVAIEVGNADAAESLVSKLRGIEGENGTTWRFAKATSLIDSARQHNGRGLEAARELAAEIKTLRPQWWGASALEAEIADLEKRRDEAANAYICAVELGDPSPRRARRAVELLYQRQAFDDIDRLVQMLSGRGMATESLTIKSALNAIRRQEFNRGIALARTLFPDNARSATDHLLFGRVLMAADSIKEATEELRRVVELAPSEPDSWLSYVEVLVKDRRLDEARSAIQTAAKALPPERSGLVLAQCYAMVGDKARAESLIHQSIDKKQPVDANTLQLAARFFMRQGWNTIVDSILARLADPNSGASPAEARWASRKRFLLRSATDNPKEVDQRIAELDRDLETDPDDLVSERARAILLAKRPGRRSEAISALEQLEKKSPLDSEEQFLVALLYGANQDLDRCQARLLKLLARPPRQARHVVFLVNVLLERGDLEQAEKWSRAALEPGSPRAIDLEVAVLKAKKQTERLRSRLEEHANKHPAQVGFVAGLFERYGYAKEAEVAYRKAINQQATDAQLVVSLINLLAYQDRAEEALALCRKARSALPDETFAGACVAVVTQARVSDSQARQIEAWLTEALGKQPGSLALQVKLARFRAFQRRYDDAEAIYRRVLATDPYNAEALNNLAWHLIFRHHKNQDALELIDRAIDASGEIASLINTRALAHLEMGNPELALPDCLRVLKHEPSTPSAHFHLARAHHLASDVAESKKAFDRAVELGLKLESVDPLERESYLKLCSELGAH
jgi:tetratricopeptide (TPR) repeat protein